jgi:hypothetical protein
MSTHVAVVACDWYTNIVNPVVVIVIARDSQRAVTPAPESMFVVIVGSVGNVNPKFTTAVDWLSVVNEMSTVPRLVQFVKLVMSVWFDAIFAWLAAIKDP